MRQGLGRGRKRQIPCTDTDVAPSGGRGHVTVTVIALSPTVQYHLSNLCPEEEPLSSFGFAPLSSPSNGDRHTSTPARPGTVRPVTFGGLGVAPTFERAPLGTGMASRARPVGTGRARSTYRHWSTGGARNTCARYSLLADSLPRWYLPEEAGQGGDAVGEGGRQGGEGGYAGASQPASQPGLPASTASSAQCPVPEPAPMRSALSCFCAQGLFNTVSLPPCPSALPVDSIISKTCHRAQIRLSRCRCI